LIPDKAKMTGMPGFWKNYGKQCGTMGKRMDVREEQLPKRIAKRAEIA
jgi:hypothetical protein